MAGESRHAHTGVVADTVSTIIADVNSAWVSCSEREVEEVLSKSCIPPLCWYIAAVTPTFISTSGEILS